MERPDRNRSRPAAPQPTSSKPGLPDWRWPACLLVAFALTFGATRWWLNRQAGAGAQATADDETDLALPESGGESAFEQTVPAVARPPGAAPPGMKWIPGGDFSMGSIDPRSKPRGGPDPMRDARPIHRVSVEPFWMDAIEVTNAQFARFIQETGYVTIAERVPDARDFPGAPPENLVAGSVVFTPPDEAIPLDDHYRWWNYVPGANWKHPTGPESTIAGREGFPVVQVAYDDALAYADWAGKRLPTEAEWEFAARGGLSGKVYAWGDDFQPDGLWMANTWQGQFPIRDTAEDGFAGIAPVAQYPPNGYGLFDMAGNVWEWCSDWYRADAYARDVAQGEPSRNPAGPESSFDPLEPAQAKRVHRGGSFLCNELYCTRYMIGTRGKGESSTASNHLGFRCVKVVNSGR